MKLGSEHTKDDPLKRIQEEINEVARREKELREKMQLQKQQQQQQQTIKQKPSIENGTQRTSTVNLKHNTTNIANNTTTNTNKILSDANKEIILDETHSDDSGFSTSSSPINGAPATEKKYIRSSGYRIVPSPPPQKLLVRTMSTPQIFQPTRRFTFNPSQKGVMQRFIASRGKLIAAQQQKLQQNSNYKDNGSNSLDYFKNGLNDGTSAFTSLSIITPPVIERDADGRPIRRGYIPVEEKIQKELKDLKNRETELKRLRKLTSRQSQPDLLDSIDNEDNLESDDESDVEHCFGPGKLRTSKSISELCDALNSNSISRRTTPSPNFDHKMHQNNHHNHGGMRPAVSLAQLCDLDPEETPSSHKLIAKWESLIQQNA